MPESSYKISRLGLVLNDRRTKTDSHVLFSQLGGIDFLVLLIAIAFALGPMQNTMALNYDQDIFVSRSVLCQ